MSPFSFWLSSELLAKSFPELCEKVLCFVFFAAVCNFQVEKGPLDIRPMHFSYQRFAEVFNPSQCSNLPNFSFVGGNTFNNGADSLDQQAQNPMVF